MAGWLGQEPVSRVTRWSFGICPEGVSVLGTEALVGDQVPTRRKLKVQCSGRQITMFGQITMTVRCLTANFLGFCPVFKTNPNLP